MSEVMFFEIAVSSHDLLQAGICEAESRYAVVVADSYGEGMALAAQMVMAREAMAKSPFDMVTGAYPYV